MEIAGIPAGTFERIYEVKIEGSGAIFHQLPVKV
jgi:hypothetical protein